MKKLKLISLILTVVLLVACASTTETEQTTGQEDEVQTEQTTGQEPFVSITDHAGREVTLFQKPERIVSGYYITSSILIGLGAQDKIVGIENMADTRPVYALTAPELLEVPGVGTAKEFNIEGTAALKPDVVIVPLKLQDAAETLTELGIPTICVNPENKQLLNETIEMLGAITDSVERANELIDVSENALLELSKLLEETQAPTVYLGGNSDLLSTAGALMYQNDLITNAGATNVAQEIEDTYWATISYEQLLAFDPDYIIIAPAAKYTVEQVMEDSAISELTAIKNGNVYKMPNVFEAWDSPVPSSYLGSLWIASVIHQDVYTANDFEQHVLSFYQDFYNYQGETELSLVS